MNRFSIGQAWSNATSFFTGGGANFAVIIIGFGILIPFILQWVIMGDPMGNAFNPVALADGGDALTGMGVALIAISLLSYILQFGSYFASWRLGLGGDRSDLVGGLRYGMVAATIYIGLLIAAGILTGLLAYATTPWLVFPLLLFIMLFFVIIYPPLFGFLAIMMLLLAAIGSFAMNSMAPFMGEALGSGVALMIMVLFGLLFLWLAARLCCTAPAMADRQDYLPFDAMRRSWALTAEGQWKIVGYFLLIGVVLLVLAIILGLVIGSSFQSMMMNSSAPGIGGMLALTILVSIPIAYFTVAVPAGIYRTLSTENAGEIFS